MLIMEMLAEPGTRAPHWRTTHAYKEEKTRNLNIVFLPSFTNVRMILYGHGIMLRQGGCRELEALAETQPVV